MPRKVHKLNVALQYDFFLIGIASHVKDYKMSWALNNSLGFELVREEDLEVVLPKEHVTQQFARYAYTHEEAAVRYDLIANICDNGHLIKELANMDFFLKVSGEQSIEEYNQLLNNIREMPDVVSAFDIPPASVKHPEYFVF